METYSKVFVTGNSITLGFGTHGMASTDVDTDWYYHVSVALKKANPSVQINRYPRGNWEGQSTPEGRINELEINLAAHLEPDTDLILLQLGDNVNSPEKRTHFRDDVVATIQWFRKKCPDARIIWIYGWYNIEDNLDLLKDALTEANVELSDICAASVMSEYRNFVGAHYVGEDGKDCVIDNAGVASHPNDLGMKRISEIVLETIFN